MTSPDPIKFLREFNRVNGPILANIGRGKFSRFYWRIYFSMLGAEIAKQFPESWRIKRAASLGVAVLIVIFISYLIDLWRQ